MCAVGVFFNKMVLVEGICLISMFLLSLCCLFSFV